MSNLFQVEALFNLSEREEDLDKGGMEDLCGKLFQVAMEEVEDKEVKNRFRQQGEGGVKGQAKTK